MELESSPVHRRANALGNEVVDPPPLHDSHGQAIADSVRGTAAAHSGAAFSDAETDGKRGSSTNRELLRVESALRRRESEVANLERRLKQSRENLRVTEKENEAREQALSALVRSLEERLARTDQRANTSSGRGSSVEDEGLDWRALLEQLREAAHQLSRGSASGCSDDDVKAILHKVLKDAAASKYKVAALKEEVAALREEAAQLKSELALRDTELEQLKEQLKRELKRRGLHCGGTKAVLQARMDEALASELHEAQDAADEAEVLARERVMHAAELKVPMLQKELQKRGLKSTGLKGELVARLVGDMDRDKKRVASLPEFAAAAADEVQDMFSEAARGLAALEVSTTADVLPLKLSPAGSLQPEPLACSKERMLELRKWYEALGRLMGGALWHRKTLPVPFSRFFCRRILEMVPTFRLKAYSAAGAGPAVFSGSVAALIGTRVTVLRDDGLDESRWKHSPHPRLVRASPGMSYVVKESQWCAGTCFT